MSQMDQIMSCQISFIPLKNSNVNASVDQIIELIKKSNLDYRIGMMSTELRGNRELILELINTLLDYATENTQFILDVRFSNQCGLAKNV
ncbi:thiamine-binding protein [Acetobacterium bakii]|uniref:Thiamine-binding protein domain-containing protein n=1 Tax=Acetobacterium bakii TaxID=52689 RepID=A0A0L6U4V5_9FIRM|nr:thiamine-binding protein [Acetobacterium bakii]KNZ43337.1 hypothetical protein AKG39_01140 [Acetobacterium bakii]